MRTVPDGFPRKAPTASTPEEMSSSAGRNERSSVSPASVVDTERVVEPLFESLHGVAQRRLGHAELGRRAGKAALLRDDREGGKVVQILPFHLCTKYISPSEL